MKLAGTKWSALCAGLLPLLVLTGCGSSDDGGDAGSGAGPTGAGGSTGGTGGAGGSTGGSAGKSAGGGGSTGGSAGGSMGGAGGSMGGAGGSMGGSAGKGGGSAGTAGSGGGVSPPGVPTTCEAAHGEQGCCFEGNAYYFGGSDVTKLDCKSMNKVCGWKDMFYDCVDAATADPSGKFPLDCGGPNIAGTCDGGSGGGAGAGGAPAHNDGACCAAADAGGTGCMDSTIEKCVCAKDDYCCSSSWDATCAKEVQQFGCGFCSPACTTNTDCATSTDYPACDPGVKHCVECVANADCVTAKKGASCDTKTHTCVECGADADCAGSKNGTVCDTTTSKCVECNTNAQCASSPNGKVCDTKAHTCVECGADADCAGSKNGTKCNTSLGVCAQCAVDADCKDKAGLPMCNAATGLCVPNCCAPGAEGTMGCMADTTIEKCVCAMDDYCCMNSWDSQCVAEVEKFGCGFCSAACSTNADCSGSPTTPACDGTSKHCVECVANADCANNKNGAACDTMKHACVECINNADCAGSKNGAICDTTKNACVECSSDTDCASSPNGKFCSNSQTCVACKSDFDCTDPKAPSCVADATGKLACGTSAQCMGDDASENNDDGPAGATDITPDASGTKTVDGHSICGLPASEADYFKVNVNDGDNLDVSVSWTDTMADVDVFALDAKGNALGINYYQNPATIKLTYLPKGAVYLMVNRYDGQTGSATVTPYKITATVKGGNKCATSADCAAEYNTQIYRGSCNTGTGACVSIDGKGAVTDGGACDSGDDCKSGKCDYTPFIKSADKLGVCTTTCDPMAPKCTSSQVCSEYTLGGDNICAGKCTTDDECPADLSTPPMGTGTWSHLTCDKATGSCTSGAGG